MGNDMKMMGLLDEMMSKAEEEDNGTKYLVTKNINKEMTAALEKTHHFGYPDAKIAKFWDIPLQDAQNRICGNCEYFDNCTEALAEIKPVIPESDGYCHKYEFACSSSKVCDSWEEGAEYYED
jgi:hypothetical protein